MRTIFHAAKGVLSPSEIIRREEKLLPEQQKASPF